MVYIMFEVRLGRGILNNINEGKLLQIFVYIFKLRLMVARGINIMRK